MLRGVYRLILAAADVAVTVSGGLRKGSVASRHKHASAVKVCVALCDMRDLPNNRFTCSTLVLCTRDGRAEVGGGSRRCVCPGRNRSERR
jgi:hypothetical protein